MQARCIGCKTCVVACPYGAMEVVVRPVVRNSGMGLNVRAEKAEANKCDLCYHRDAGPACMEACPTHALVCVDRDKLEQMSAESAVAQRSIPPHLCCSDPSWAVTAYSCGCVARCRAWAFGPSSGNWLRRCS